MALNTQRIWEYLKTQGFTDFGAAGLMGNLYAESALNPKNLQSSYEKKLGHTDESYTSSVDSGEYTNFVKDKAGYGLAQWTYWSRKQNLLDYAKARRVSIGDLHMQLGFLVKELGEYGLLEPLRKASSVREASDMVLLRFEKPADQSEAVQKKRAEFGQRYLEQFSKSAPVGGSFKEDGTVTEQKLRQKVADIINAWVGSQRGDVRHLEILDIYNSYAPLARGYKVKVSDAHCATTVSAAYIKAGIAGYTGTECGAEELCRAAQKKGIWVENDAHVPQIGDACAYDWQDGSNYAATDNRGWTDHVGIVTAVDKSAKTFVVTEGNMSGGKVGKRTMSIGGRYIRGFICPDFAAIAKAMTPPPAEEKKEDEDMTLERFKEFMAQYRKELQDNDAGAWSAEARAWAIDTGLINGIGKMPDGTPNYAWGDQLTREQMATLLYRFAKMMGK